MSDELVPLEKITKEQEILAIEIVMHVQRLRKSICDTTDFIKLCKKHDVEDVKQKLEKAQLALIDVLKQINKAYLLSN